MFFIDSLSFLSDLSFVSNYQANVKSRDKWWECSCVGGGSDHQINDVNWRFFSLSLPKCSIKTRIKADKSQDEPINTYLSYNLMCEIIWTHRTNRTQYTHKQTNNGTNGRENRLKYTCAIFKCLANTFTNCLHITRLLGTVLLVCGAA